GAGGPAPSSGWRRPAWPVPSGGIVRRGGPPVKRSRLQIEQRRLLGSRRPSARCRWPLLARARAAPAEFLPSLLVRDALALLDHEQVDQTGQRIAQEPEVALPVPR